MPPAYSWCVSSDHMDGPQTHVGLSRQLVMVKMYPCGCQIEDGIPLVTEGGLQVQPNACAAQ